MSKREDYQCELRRLKNWIPYLMEHSCLPGPRGNLELAAAAADEGTTEMFESFVSFDPEHSLTNTPGEFVAACGAIGFGRLVADGEIRYLTNLQILAEDPRWRVREGVAMGLQRIGEKNMPLLLEEMKRWSRGMWLVQRAAVAGLCEPGLLRTPTIVRQVIDILDRVMENVEQADAISRRTEPFRSLRQTMGYCWSVVLAADISLGRPRFTRWLCCGDPDVIWIVKENLAKKRLEKVDACWVKKTQSQLVRSQKRKSRQ